MTRISKLFGSLGAVVWLLTLAACSSPTPTSTPTLDTNPLRTEVAATVLSQVTQDLALTPSITPLPSPTATIPSTATTAPTQAASSTPLVTVTLASGTVTATLATTPTEAAGNNRAEWVSQSIPDDTIFAPGQTFTMTWQLKNAGDTTWTAGYVLRFYSGDRFGAPVQISLSREVPPGDIVDISLPMKAPARVGTYLSVWVMATENLSNFKESVFLQIVVAVTPTPTRTPPPTLTPTPQP